MLLDHTLHLEDELTVYAANSIIANEVRYIQIVRAGLVLTKRCHIATNEFNYVDQSATVKAGASGMFSGIPNSFSLRDLTTLLIHFASIAAINASLDPLTHKPFAYALWRRSLMLRFPSSASSTTTILPSALEWIGMLPAR